MKLDAGSTPSSNLGVILLAMNILRPLQATAQPEVDLKRTYDAIVIGSGAAGGMVAHVLTSQGATRVDPLVALRHESSSRKRRVVRDKAL